MLNEEIQFTSRNCRYQLKAKYFIGLKAKSKSFKIAPVEPRNP